MKLADLPAVIIDRGYVMAAHLRHRLLRAPGEAALKRYAVGSLDPVLLLPGVYETWQFMRPIGDRLNALGHPIHVLPTLGNNLMTISDSAELATNYLEAHDLTRVIIVGHSKGGLIGKQMLLTDAVRSGLAPNAARIVRVIAINSPFGGTPLARWSLLPAVRHFVPTEVALVALAANREANAHITSIYSRFDPLIPTGSRLDDATNVRLDIVGHFSPLNSLLVWAAVENALSLIPPREKA